jgi:hypothetical protein
MNLCLVNIHLVNTCIVFEYLPTSIGRLTALNLVLMARYHLQQ